MVSAGDEKRIQALYHELRRQDENAAPVFENLWPRQRSKVEYRRSLVLVGAALVVVTLCVVAWWWAPKRGEQQPASNAFKVTPPGPGLIAEPPSPHVATNGPAKAVKSRVVRRFVSHKPTRATKDNIIREALAISSWQSPTATLMEFSATSALQSVPQLNQSVKDLQLFLPGSVKERNQ